MTLGRRLALAAAAGYVALLAYVSGATQCPARELGPCARVHAMLATTSAGGPVVLAAVPMSGARGQR